MSVLINMGSCRKFKIFIVIFFIALSISCSNFINLTSNIEDEEVELAGETETGVITAKNDKESVYVKLNILGYTDSMENNSRTLLPPEEDGSSVSKYALFGCLRSTQMNDYEVSSDKQELGSWTDYSQMTADSVEIIPGTWDFSLFAYKNVNGEDKIYATALIENQEVGGQTGSLELDFIFTFDNSDFNTGSLNVTINVPYNQVTSALVSLYTYNASNQKVFQNLTNSIYTPSGGSAGVNSSFTISESAIPVGYYFLKVDFYTSSTTSPSASRVQYVKILGGQNTGGNLTYTQLNNSYSILYHDSISGDTEEVVNNSINPSSYNNSTSVSLEDASCQHYEFGGWYENADFSGSPVSSWTAGEKNENLVLYAKWTPKSYPVVFHDWAAGQTSGKTYSGTYDGFETSATAASGYCLTYKARLPSSSFDTVANPLIDSNTVEFVGWFSNQDCTSASAISSNAKVNDSILTDSDGDGELDTLDLYAKWNYSYVYVDPSSRNTDWVATDENRGFSPNQALLTVEEAKKYLQGNDKAKYVYLLSTAILDGSSSVNNPSEISDKSIYGDGTNPVIVMRHSTFPSDALLNISVDTTLKDVILDGGAVWDDEGPAGNNGTGVNTGHTSESSLIVLYKTGELPELTLDSNVVIQNNDNIGTTYPGGGIRVYGKLFSNSTSNVIRACRSYSMGGGIFAGANSVIDFTKGMIGGNSSSDGNVSLGGNGSAIYTVSNVTVNLGDSSITLGEVSVSNNYTTQAGAISLRENSTLDAVNANISYNVSEQKGGGIIIIGNSAASFGSCVISYNSSSGGGGGILLYPDTDDSEDGTLQTELINVSLTNTSITGNIGSYGAGAYFDCGKVQISGGGFLNNQATNKGGAFYISNSVPGSSLVSSVKLTDAVIIMGNSSNSSAGAVYVDGQFQMNGGNISNNTCLEGNGGGIVVTSSCKKEFYSYIRNVNMSGNTSTVSTGVPGQDIHVNSAGYFTIDSSKLESSSSSTYSIVNTGRLYVSGLTYLSNVYLSNTAYGFIYPRNYFVSGTATTDTVTSNLITSTSSGGKVATLTSARELPAVDYVDSDSTTYIVALKEETAGDMSGLTSLFKLNVSTHKINSEGRIISRSSNYNNNITDPSTTQLYFGISSATVSSSANQPELTITAYSDSTKTLEATSASSWWCTLLYNGLTNTGAELNDVGANGAQKSIHFYKDNINFQPGSYILTVGASINGTAYSDSFTITVN